MRDLTSLMLSFTVLDDPDLKQNEVEINIDHIAHNLNNLADCISDICITCKLCCQLWLLDLADSYFWNKHI